MFLKKLMENNPALIDYAFRAHQDGTILPDTYVLDLDAIVENGKKMLEVAKPLGIDLHFMLKQIGRNPLVGKALQDIGFKGCVAVDYKEALLLGKNGIHLGNIGHLVQIPESCLKQLLQQKPDLITVYSYEKILEINEVAEELNIVQPLLIRITDEDSNLYSGQIAGIHSSDLPKLIDDIGRLSNVKVGGFTVFPAMLYDGGQNAIIPTVNMKAMDRARDIARQKGLEDLVINLPSANCCASLPLVHELGGNNAEPGHGLTGTTPLHKVTDQPEKVGYVYVSEISHNYDDKAYCYGGGYYRRGHMENVLVGTGLQNSSLFTVRGVDDDSIDYHFEIDGNHRVGDTAILCFRTQVFTTRSHVAVVKGLQNGKPELLGLYDAFGELLQYEW